MLNLGKSHSEYGSMFNAHLHFVIENFGLAGLWAGDEMFVEHVQYVGADVAELLLHLTAVRSDHVQFVFGALEYNEQTL